MSSRFVICRKLYNFGEFLSNFNEIWQVKLSVIYALVTINCKVVFKYLTTLMWISVRTIVLNFKVYSIIE